MKWKANFESKNYQIKHDPIAGFYIYVFDGGKCIYDDLQDSLEIAINCAWKYFGVPKDAWVKIEG